MEFLVALVAAIGIGLLARQRGLNGLQWGGLAGALLFLTSSGIEFYRQAAGAPSWAWWVVAAVIVAALLAAIEGQGPAAVVPNQAAQETGEAKKIQASTTTAVQAKGERAGQALGAVAVALVGAGWLWTACSEKQEAPAPQGASPTSAVSQPEAAKAQSGSVEVWDCVSTKNPGQLWRTIQFEPDNIYVYVGDETGTPSWGRYERQADGSLRMTVDEDERWVQWNTLDRSGTAFTMANTYGLQVVCQATSKRLARPAKAPSGMQQPAAPVATSNQAAPAAAGTEAGKKVVYDAYFALGQLQAAIKDADANPTRSQQCDGVMGMAKGSMGSVMKQLDEDKTAAEGGSAEPLETFRGTTKFLNEMYAGIQRECLQAASAKPQRQAQPGEAAFNTIDQFLRAHRTASTSGNPACRAMAQSIQTYPESIARSLDQARAMPSDEQKLMFVKSAARQAESGLNILRSQCR